MKKDVDEANSVSLSQKRLSINTNWPEIYEYVKSYPYKGLIDIAIDEKIAFVVNCMNDDAIALQYLWTGGRLTEPVSINVWRKLARRSRTTLDIGAYTGFYALIAASVSSVPIYSYEPVSFIYARLAENVMLNGFSNVKFINKAVSDRIGTVEIGIRFGPQLFSSGSSISPEMVNKAAYSQPTHTVTVDSEHRDEKVDLIKIDVEGAEESVLKGAMALLTNSKPILLLETRSSSHAACMSIIDSLGYKSQSIEDSGGARNSIIYHPSSHLYSELTNLGFAENAS